MSAAERPPGARCDVCGSPDLRTRYSDCPDRRHWLGVFDVVECRECGTGRTVPRPSAEEVGRFYPPEYGSYAADPWARGLVFRTLRTAAQAPALLRYGRPSVPTPPVPGARALELGSGTGERLAALARAGWAVTGIEPDEQAVGFAHERFPELRGSLLGGRAEDAAFEPGSFDLVLMEHVLEHLHEPVPVLARTRGWMRDGGTLRLWVPNFSCLERRLFGGYWYGLDLPRHLSHFTERAVRAALRDTGFTVTRVVPEIQAATLAGSVRQLLDGLLRRRRQDASGRFLYYLAMPVAAALQAAGHRPTIDVSATATPR
jgi:SAM-dependent methyltransferase